jgi:hypothetical protein
MEATQSLHIIEEMINRSRTKISENGQLYLFWGWLSFFLSIAHYVLQVHMQFSWAPLVWLGTFIGLAYQIYYLKTKKKKDNVMTFVDRSMIYIWSAFGVGMFFVILSMPILNYQPNPWIILFYGMATFQSGGVLKFKPLIIGGIASWIIAFIAMNISLENQMIALSASIVCSYIIPGHLLKKNPISRV